MRHRGRVAAVLSNSPFVSLREPAFRGRAIRAMLLARLCVLQRRGCPGWWCINVIAFRHHDDDDDGGAGGGGGGGG